MMVIGKEMESVSWDQIPAKAICICFAQNHLRNPSLLLQPMVWFVGFYCISTLEGYLMPNPLYIYDL